MTNNINVIGERLKEARKEMGYSLEKVAEVCQVQQYQTVSKWESGNSSPSLKNLLQLCELYGCELGYLIGMHNCKTRKNADIQEETGLSENAINKLRAENAFDNTTIQAINALVEFNDGSLLKDIKNFLFYQFSGEVEAGNVIINGDNLADVFLLEIISQLKALRNKANGGIE